MDFVTVLGAIACFVATVSFLPQALKVWKTQSTKDISLGMYAFYFLAVLLWVFYALLIKAWPFLIAKVITGVMVCYILIKKVKEP